VVEVNADGAVTRWWLGPEGELLQEQYTELGQFGPSKLIMKYSDWKSFDGLRFRRSTRCTAAMRAETAP